MPLVVKICGLSTRATRDAALPAGADMVGFVFFPASPRHVDLETARELAKRAQGRAQRWRSRSMPTTPRSPISSRRCSRIFCRCMATRPSRGCRHQAGLRLTGHEGAGGGDSGRSRAVAGLCSGRRSHPVRCPRAKDATRPGGLGSVFDWPVQENLDLKLPFMVSGGLMPAMSRRRPRHPRRRCRYFLRRRARARRQGSRADPRFHSRRARH